MKTTLIDNDLTLAVEDAIPASPVYAPEEILALAVCASPNGSRDAGDLALLHAARERGIPLPYAQRENSWEAPSRERPYSTAVLKEEAGSFPPPVKQQLDSPAQARLRRIMRAARPIRLRDAVAGSGTAAAAMALRLASWEALACNVVLSTTRYLT